ncbi:MAG TPA: hypothetical protein VIS52_08375 [Motiliproteus sp.]
MDHYVEPQLRDELLQEAAVLLRYYADPAAQYRRLRAIESQLRRSGQSSSELHQRIDAIAAEADPAWFRCCYQHFESS